MTWDAHQTRSDGNASVLGESSLLDRAKDERPWTYSLSPTVSRQSLTYGPGRPEWRRPAESKALVVLKMAAPLKLVGNFVGVEFNSEEGRAANSFRSALVDGWSEPEAIMRNRSFLSKLALHPSHPLGVSPSRRTRRTRLRRHSNAGSDPPRG